MDESICVSAEGKGATESGAELWIIPTMLLFFIAVWGRLGTAQICAEKTRTTLTGALLVL